jgi:hypothetical protein
MEEGAAVGVMKALPGPQSAALLYAGRTGGRSNGGCRVYELPQSCFPGFLKLSVLKVSAVIAWQLGQPWQVGQPIAAHAAAAWELNTAWS